MSVTDRWPPVSSLRSRTSVRRPVTDASGAGGLEELDWVAGGILEEDLLTARPADDVVAERQAGGAQPLDLGRDVFDNEVDAVPAAWLRGAAVGHRPSGRTLGTAEQQAQVAAHHVGERGRGAGAHGEVEVGGVEAHGLLDVVDHVADVDELVRHVRSPPGCCWWSLRSPRSESRCGSKAPRRCART